MTYPITPNPGIHDDSYNRQQQFLLAEHQLQYWAQQLPAAMTKLVVEAIIRALNGVLPAGWQEQLAALETALAPVLQTINDIEALINGIGGTVIADVVAAIKLAQRIIDDVINLITGGSGTNHALTDLNAALQSIPASFITGVTATEQNIINSINTALGQAGTTIASIETALKLIPTANMLPVLGGAHIGDDLQKWANSFVGNISGQTTGSLTAIQNQWTAFTKGFIGYAPPASSGAQPGTPPGNSLAAFSQTTDGFNKGQATTKQIANNVDPTLDPTFHLSTVSTTMPTTAVTQAGSVIGMISIPDVAAQKDQFAWLGYPSGGSMSTLTGFYFNLYAMNLSTGALSWVYTTPNLQGSVAGGSSVLWNYYTIPNTTTSGTVTACAVQTVNLGTPTGGTYKLTFGSATTSTLQWNDSAATVQTALAALSGIGTGNVSVVAVNPITAAYGGPFIVTFTGTLANTAQTMLTITSSLTGSNTTAAVSPYVGVFQGDVYAVELVVVGSGTYNLVGQTSLVPAITASGMYPQRLGASRAASSVAYDAAGAGAHLNNQTSSSSTISWSHTATAGAYVVVSAFAQLNLSGSVSSITVTYGGVTMTSLGSVSPNNTANSGLLQMFGLANVSGGTQTVTVTATFSGTINNSLAGDSVSYLNTGLASTVTTSYGSSTSPSVTATGVTGGIVVNAICGTSLSSAATLSGYTKTQRFLYSSNATYSGNIVIGDSSTVGSVTFAATVSAGYTAGIAVVLQQSLSTIAPSTIASPTYAAVTPWLALSGGNASTAYPPVLTTFSTAGTFSYSVPTWATKLDVVVVGGGGGMFTTTTTSTYYTGGLAGQWATGTWTATGLSTVAVTVGAGGAAQGAAYPSSAVATGRTTVSGAGGTAGGSTYGYAYASSILGSWYYSAGMSPGNTAFNGNTYYGGAAGAANAPGGGGQGNPFGGAGAPGAVFILAYQ